MPGAQVGGQGRGDLHLFPPRSGILSDILGGASSDPFDAMPAKMSPNSRLLFHHCKFLFGPFLEVSEVFIVANGLLH